MRQTPRRDSFCAYATFADEPFQVPDATLDARFAGTPLVAGEPNARFYAEVPLTTNDGLGQGYLIARPMLAENSSGWLDARQ